MARRNSGSVFSQTGMTPTATPRTPTEVEAEKEAERIKMQGKQLANEEMRVQKKSFTNWMNSYLKQKNMKVEDLFEDIKDGVYLLSLLEVLSGEKLKMEKRKLMRVHHVSNISTALSFLEQKKVILVNINVSDIADGKPHTVLGLMWTIILHFQVEDTFTQTATDKSGERLPLSASMKFRMNAKEDLLTWTGNAITKKYGIKITNFGKSWRDGLAFNALIDTINPDLVDFDQCRKENARTNLEQAFSVANSQLGIPRLLDIEDVDVENPDEKSVMTYVAQFMKAYLKAGEDPSIMARNRMWTCQYCTLLNDTSCDICDACGNKKVQDDHYIVDNVYPHKRTQDTSTVELGVESEIRIVLIGRTGAGKSATANTILGKREFESKMSGSSVTSICKRGKTIQAGRKVIVVDTPGLFDTNMTNEKVTKEIVKCIGITSPGPHAMVLVIGIGRITKEEKDTVHHFVDHFGKGMLRYMIVLFTRQDELSKRNQSIHEYVESIPNEIKEILHQCGDRYIAFNNDADGQTKREQVSQFFGMLDLMLTGNGGCCYTNELYARAEETLQRRMRHQKEILEKTVRQERDEIIRQVEKKYEKELEKGYLEKNRIEKALKSTKIAEEKLKEKKVALVNEIKRPQNQLADRSNMDDGRDMKIRIDLLQKQLNAADYGNIEKKRKQLQRDFDESNRRWENILEEKNKEFIDLVERHETENKSMTRQERDEIIRLVEKKYEQKLEKASLEKSRLEEALKSTKIAEEKLKEENVTLENEIKKLQNQLADRSNMDDGRNIKIEIRLKEQLHAVDDGNIERERQKLQRDLDESNRRCEKILEEKNKECRDLVERYKIENKSKTNSEILRQNERDNIEKEQRGALEEVCEGVKGICTGVWKAGKAFVGLFGY